MIRVIVFFLFLSLAVGVGITVVRHMTGKELWSLTKTIGFSLLCGTIALAFMSILVVLF